MKLTDTDYYVLACMFKGKAMDDATEQRVSEHCRTLMGKLRHIEDLHERWDYAFYARLLSRVDFQRIRTINTDAPPPATRARLQPATSLFSLPPIEFLIEGEIPKRSLIVVYGESGVGKSFVVLDYALRIAQTHAVCYVPTEGLTGYARRLWAWSEYRQTKIPPNLYFLRDTFNLLDQTAIVEVINDLSQIQPRMQLLVIDTLAMSMIGADENSARDMGMALSACRRLIESLDCSVMLVHHSGKASMWERGSSALRGNSDVMIRIASVDDVLQMECSKAKDFAAFPRRYLSLEKVGNADQSSMVVVPYDTNEGERKTMTANQRAVMEALKLETCQGGASLRELVEITGVPLSTLHRAVSALLRKGQVIKGHGGYKLSTLGLESVPGVPPGVPLASADSEKATTDHDELEGLQTAREGGGVPLFQVFHGKSGVQKTFLAEQVEQAEQRNAYYLAGL